MRREFHVRFCERAAVGFLCATHPIVGFEHRHEAEQFLAGTAMEISRFPCKGLLRMPGSTTTRGRHVSCDIDTRRVAFCWTENIGTPTCLTPLNTSPAPSPVNASRLTSRTYRASLGASAVRYSFTVTDFHRLPFAGLPAHPSTASFSTIRSAARYVRFASYRVRRSGGPVSWKLKLARPLGGHT